MRGAALLAACLLLAGAAQGQTALLTPLTRAEGPAPAPRALTAHRDWALDCEDGCTLRQSAQEGVVLEIDRATCAATPVATLTLPHGLALVEGLTLSIDAQRIENIPVRACFPTGCLAAIEMTGPLLARMRAGLSMTLDSQYLDTRSFTARFSLLGFTAGYRAFAASCD